MKRILRISLALSLLATAPAVFAQDAAAPFRRPSPTPAPEETPASEPAETQREEERQEEEEPPRRAEPATTPAPPARAEQPPAPTPAAEAEKPAPAPAAKSSRKALQVEPVRAVEPRPPGSRRPRPQEPQDDPNRREGEPPKPRERDEEPARREESRPPKPPERERERDEQGDRPPATAAQGKRAATLDYWDDDPGSVVKRLERKWQKALVNKDVDTINDLLARDFVATSSTGRVGSKSTLLNAIRRDKNEYKSADARGMSVRMLGPRVAVVTGIATESGTTPDGRSFRNSRRFTDTWMLRNGKWLCVASQATELPND